MNRILLVFFTVITFLVSCKSRNAKSNDAAYQNSKETIADIERKTPSRFLTVSSSHKKNIIGQTVVSGKVSNVATLVAYKNIGLKIVFLNQAGAVLESDIYPIKEIIQSSSGIEFKSKYFAPKESAAVKVTVAEAEANQ